MPASRRAAAAVCPRGYVGKSGHPGLGWGCLLREGSFFPTLAASVTPAAVVDSFTWVVYPEGGLVRGKIYTDGSRLDGPSKLLARNGWSFVALDTEGGITAAANGIPPNWVDDIPGGGSLGDFVGGFQGGARDLVPRGLQALR